MAVRADIMVDLETLGTGVDATVFQIAACSFDITTGEILGQFNLTADISKEPVHVDGSTLQWWLNTNKELLATLLNSGSVSEEALFTEFRSWLEHPIEDSNEDVEIYLWGNGILFDNNIIRAHMEKYGIKYPIFYRNDRDLRTLLELASLKSGVPEKDLRNSFQLENTTAHDAYDDVRNQINIAHNCYKIIMS